MIALPRPNPQKSRVKRRRRAYCGLESFSET
jgi:hypothetical protein